MPEPQKDDKPTQGSETPPAPATWDEYVAAHPDAAPLYDAATASLKSALDKEREARGTAEKRLRELAKTASPEVAAELRKQADEMKAEAEATKAQLDFVTAAVRLGCKAPDKAWVFAHATGMTAEQMKADPDLAYLFKDVKAADAKAGAGTGSAPKPQSDNERINAGIRAALGRPA